MNRAAKPCRQCSGRHPGFPTRQTGSRPLRHCAPREHYTAQDKPLFELIEGEGEKAHVTPLFSIPEILNAVKAVGKKGIQMTRFKGLGEMDAKELFETTMNPAKRKLLRIDLTDAVEAEEMFTKLMGDDVEPRRQFIEDNALNVRNLDV